MTARSLGTWTAPGIFELHQGRAWKFGDSVDTNQLAVVGQLGAGGEESLRANCLRGVRPEFAEQVKPGDILIAGKNFGCGSSRQTAVDALQLNGISVVLAESVARLHRRNSVAVAFPTFVVAGITDAVADGDDVQVDYPQRLVRNLTTGATLRIENLSPSVEAIYRVGGLTQIIAHRLAEQGIFPPVAST